MTVFDLEQFEGVFINFEKCLLNETVWVQIDGRVLRYEFGRLYINGELYVSDIEINSLVETINEAVDLLNFHNTVFILARYDGNIKQYISANSYNLSGWLEYGYRLVGVVAR